MTSITANTLPPQHFGDHLQLIPPGRDTGSAEPGIDRDISFGDVLDVINPLHHVPVVGTVYRAVSGDELTGASRVLGGLLYGGPIGFVMGMANAVLSDTTGKTADEHALALVGLGGDDSQESTPVQAATTSDDAAGEGVPVAVGAEGRGTLLLGRAGLDQMVPNSAADTVPAGLGLGGPPPLPTREERIARGWLPAATADADSKATAAAPANADQPSPGALMSGNAETALAPAANGRHVFEALVDPAFLAQTLASQQRERAVARAQPPGMPASPHQGGSHPVSASGLPAVPRPEAASAYPPSSPADVAALMLAGQDKLEALRAEQASP